MKNLHNKHFPGENKNYRDARNALLKAEIKLRKQIEDVAALRRKLPAGGKIKEDYIFEEIDPKTGKIKETKLSELFEPGKNSLVVYSFMYHPDDEIPCPSCTSIMDGVNGMVFHAEQRTNFVVISKAPIKKFIKWAKKKGWKNLRLLSSFKNNYNSDYFSESESGGQLPVINVFRKKGKSISHFYNTELLYVPAAEGQNPRHVDSIWPLWSIFDMIPEGRGEYYPKHIERK